MDYIKEMRNLVGTRPLLLPGALVIVEREDGKILLTRRTDTGEWSLPGGHMEPGETIQDTARREVREETNIEVGDLELVGIFSGQNFYYKYPNGDEIFKVTIVYSAPLLPSEVRPDRSEVLELSYFDVGRLPDNLFDQERTIIEAYAESRTAE
ncbi:NUDIX hydrolase [Streptomyces sp. NPDC001493]